MGIIVTYGALAVFFAIVIAILQRSYVADRDFSDFTVAGRSFGGFYQAMAFLNTFLPGTVFITYIGFVARRGVVGIGVYILLAPLVMFLMAHRVWTWGARHDLRTQPELFALRFNSRAARVLAAVVGVAGLLPWMVLGMQALGAVFHALALGHIGFTSAVILGVAVMTVRQFWTIRMGMRGIVISDMFQGVVAYIGGSVVLIGLIAWLYGQGATLAAVAPAKFFLPGPDSHLPLLFFSLNFVPLLCSLSWPDLFVRLYTGSGVDSVKRSSAYCAPVMLLFVVSLSLFALLASTRPDAAAAPDSIWFTLNLGAGGPVLLALAGVVVFAASMGNIDATVQSCGAQIANDILQPLRGPARPMDDRALRTASQIAMAVITLGAAFIACLPLHNLFAIALFAFQIMVQISVPLYFGIFTRFGDKTSAIAALATGMIVACALQVLWPIGIPWAYGLTSGAVALILNFCAYTLTALIVPRAAAEQARLDALFAVATPPAAAEYGPPITSAS